MDSPIGLVSTGFAEKSLINLLDSRVFRNAAYLFNVDSGAQTGSLDVGICFILREQNLGLAAAAHAAHGTGQNLHKSSFVPARFHCIEKRDGILQSGD